MRKEILGGVIAGLIVGVIGFAAGSARTKLSTDQIRNLAREVTTGTESEAFLRELAQREEFRGRQGRDGADGTSGVDDLPVGTLIASLAPEVDFVSRTSVDGKRLWVLANGASAPSGSAYAQQFGGVLPDLQGRFVMGATNRESVGKSQASSLEEHMHTLELAQWTGGASGDWAAAFSGTGEARGAATSDGRSGAISLPMIRSAKSPNETRPKHVPAYWYVKVNNP